MRNEAGAGTWRLSPEGKSDQDATVGWRNDCCNLVVLEMDIGWQTSRALAVFVQTSLLQMERSRSLAWTHGAHQGRGIAGRRNRPLPMRLIASGARSDVEHLALNRRGLHTHDMA